MIDQFRGKYLFLSNFYACKVEYDGLIFDSSEAAFQAQKCTTDFQKEMFVGITSSQSKKLGKMVGLRDDWEKVKIGIMKNVLIAKFTQHKILAKKLIDTGDEELIEGNWWNDTFWGVCNGKGENHLGKLLMEIRKKLKDGSNN